MNLAKAGISAAPSVTPREFLEFIEERMVHYPLVKDAMKVGTDIYEQTIYSPLAPKGEDITLLRNIIKKSNLERIKLRSQYVLHRLKKKLISLRSL